MRKLLLCTDLTELLNVWKSGQVKLAQVLRWQRHTDRPGSLLRPQNDLQHSYSFGILMQMFLVAMRKWQKLDELLLLTAVQVHDHGEGELGQDVWHGDKTAHQDLREYEAFVNRFKPLPTEIFAFFQQAFLLQFAFCNLTDFPAPERQMVEELKRDKLAEARVFNAVEGIDYLLYAFEHSGDEANRGLVAEVVRNCYPRLEIAAQELVGFKQVFYTDEFRAMLQQWLPKEP